MFKILRKLLEPKYSFLILIDNQLPLHIELAIKRGNAYYNSLSFITEIIFEERKITRVSINSFLEQYKDKIDSILQKYEEIELASYIRFKYNKDDKLIDINFTMNLISNIDNLDEYMSKLSEAVKELEIAYFELLKESENVNRPKLVNTEKYEKLYPNIKVFKKYKS